jgi:hypothetical protein
MPGRRIEPVAPSLADPRIVGRHPGQVRGDDFVLSEPHRRVAIRQVDPGLLTNPAAIAPDLSP